MTPVFILLSGVGTFFAACIMMSTNAQSLFGNVLRRLFNRVSDNKLACVGISTATTAVIQSSGATTIMIAGFADAGIITLSVAAPAIFGANIGTTDTALIAALGASSDGWKYALATFTFVGALVTLFSKKDKYKKIGGILIGFGLLFVGIILLDGLTDDYCDEIRSFIEPFTSEDGLPALLIIGILITAVFQSSSVVTVIAIGMIGKGLITLQEGIYLVIGSNIGACTATMIATWTGGKNAKRIAWMHLLFNVVGAAVFVVVGFVTGICGVEYGEMFNVVLPKPEVQLAAFHIVFNVVTTAIMLPLTNRLVHLVTQIVPDGPKEDKSGGKPCPLRYVNVYMLRTPPIAVQQIRKENANIVGLAGEISDASRNIFCSGSLTGLEEFRNKKGQFDCLNKEIVHFLAKLSSMNLNGEDSTYITGVYGLARDFGHIGNDAESIVECAEKYFNSGDCVSTFAISDIKRLHDPMRELCEATMRCCKGTDINSLKRVYECRDQIYVIADEISDAHKKRIRDGTCKTDFGAEYLLLISYIKDTAYHFVRIAETHQKQHKEEQRKESEESEHRHQ